MKKLKDILGNQAILKIIGNPDLAIKSISSDSREVEKDSLFAAVKGTKVDGHKFISNVVENGAKAVLCEDLPEELSQDVTYIQVSDSSIALAIIAHEFYDCPSENVKLVGVTGTNGKTTTVTLLYQLFMELGYKVGLISTVVNKICNREIPSTHTTPDPIQLSALLKEMVDEGCSHVFMEVSSHSLVQKRVIGLKFSGGVFTNITHDHLDYHGTFDNYISAKKLFFDHLPKDAFALTNLDDKRGMVMLQNTQARKYTYANQKQADFIVKIHENSFNGMMLLLDNREFYTPLIGTFNAYNLLAVYSVAKLLGEDTLEILTALSIIKGAKGRFEYVVSPKEKIIGIIDYAHTPDALKNVLHTVKSIKSGNEVLITVFGCGGDRDPFKRPLMGKVASTLSDRIVITSDNPRKEDPLLIIEQIKEGVAISKRKGMLSIPDRKEAIKVACSLAKANDIILIAGKGHENYQEVNGVKHPFDDKQVLLETFKEMDL
jgi:UDP-N-acetylmuramoyl-L-alanyl-D-glutamate--2,6-diaminopimelate ligase